MYFFRIGERAMQLQYIKMKVKTEKNCLLSIFSKIYKSFNLIQFFIISHHKILLMKCQSGFLPGN